MPDLSFQISIFFQFHAWIDMSPCINHLTVKRFLDSDVRHGDRSAGVGSAGDGCDFPFSSFSRRVSESFQPGVRLSLPGAPRP